MAKKLPELLSRGLLIAVLVESVAIQSAAAQYTLLHKFSGPDGMHPSFGGVTLSGSTIFGMTEVGGAYGSGVIFKMNTDGTAFTVLRNLDIYSDDGGFPYGGLTVLGTTIYGMTGDGGDLSQPGVYGTLFKMNTDGTGFTILHAFTGVPYEEPSDDGCLPAPGCVLTLAGATLYGVTEQGGRTNRGVVFKIDTNGTGYAILHHFTGTPGDEGMKPFGSLTLVGSDLFGVTEDSTYGAGVLFRINTNGTGFATLHNFDSHLRGAPTLYGSRLYGVTSFGSMYRINTDGTGYATIYEFGSGNEASPVGPLSLSGSTFYGITAGSRGVDRGTIFRINADGTGYSTLYDATGTEVRFGGFDHLTLSGTVLYGTTYGQYGGSTGTVFALSLAPNTPPPPNLLSPSGTVMGVRRPQFSWTTSTSATWYYLWINRNGSKYLDKWIQGTSWTPPGNLPEGDYNWSVRAWNSASGNGAWSSNLMFTIPYLGSGPTTPLAPTGTVTGTHNAPFTWTAADRATWYQLSLYKNQQPYRTQWVLSNTTWTATNLPVANYRWWVRGWNTDGYGSWSNADFTIGPALPGPSSPVAPTGTVTAVRRPQFSWTASTNATWTYLYMTKGGVKYYEKWVQSTNTWTPTWDLPYGAYAWWVRPWNSDGNGTWSARADFQLSP